MDGVFDMVFATLTFVISHLLNCLLPLIAPRFDVKVYNSSVLQEPYLFENYLGMIRGFYG